MVCPVNHPHMYHMISFSVFSILFLLLVHWPLSSSSLTLSSLITNLLLNPSRDRLQILYQYNFLGPINSCFLFKNLVFVYSFLVVVTFTYHKVYYFSSSFLTVYAWPNLYVFFPLSFFFFFALVYSCFVLPYWAPSKFSSYFTVMRHLQSEKHIYIRWFRLCANITEFTDPRQDGTASNIPGLRAIAACS